MVRVAQLYLVHQAFSYISVSPHQAQELPLGLSPHCARRGAGGCYSASPPFLAVRSFEPEKEPDYQGDRQ
jgi:hypothetical protein